MLPFTENHGGAALRPINNTQRSEGRLHRESIFWDG